MADKAVRYSIVIPAYQEATIIETSLEKLAKSMNDNGLSFDLTEVIVVVADSPDGTAKLALGKADLFKHFKIVEPGKKIGKGRDVRAGILETKGDYVLFTDADLATPPEHIPVLIKLMENGASVVIGIRPLSKIHNTFMRKARSVVSNLMIRTLAVPGVSDTQCGFKGFTKEAAFKLFEPLETLGWGFDIEILARARALGYKMTKVPILDWYDPKIGKMGLAGESDLRANLNTLKELLGIFANRVKGRYK